MIKKFLVGMAMLFCVNAAYALQPPVAVDQSNNGAGIAPSGFIQNLDFLGCTTLAIDQSTVPVVVTGSGELFEVDMASGTIASAYAIAFDTNTIGAPTGAATYGIGLNAVATIPKSAITPKVFTNEGTDVGNSQPAANLSGVGVYLPARPKRFVNGLGLASSDAGATVRACYRLDSWNTAQPVTK